MKKLFTSLFLDNWQRKAVSILLALVIWFSVDHSLTASKTINNIPVRVINLPQGKTVEGIHNDGLLPKKVNLTLTGRRSFLSELTQSDLEVVIDASNKPVEWIASISKKNLVSLNPDLDFSKGISNVSHHRFIIRLTKVVTEKIPIIITKPIGEPPKGYEFIDIWPYRLTLTVHGPEDVVKQLKTQGQRLTFNLSNISSADLNKLTGNAKTGKGEEVSYFVPDSWKQVVLGKISDLPIEIDDPQAKLLRIDFIRTSLISIDRYIPVTLFFPIETSQIYNPKNTTLVSGGILNSINGIELIQKPLYANGVSHLFVQTVRNRMGITIQVSPKKDDKPLSWSVLFINPRHLEDVYVNTLLSDQSDEEFSGMQLSQIEEYLRNRFRAYMNRFQLYDANDEKLNLDINFTQGKISVAETPKPLKQ